uniref:DUF2283 domain-containing protein n=1 Tax=Syphacia muris TaxID=451379 RepID=A0A0N5ACS7_9BILA
MFYHREPDTEAVVLYTESGKTLGLTELHLLPASWKLCGIN